MKATYDITQPPHMTEEEFRDFLNDINSIVIDGMCADCDKIKTCNGPIACIYYEHDRTD